MGRGLSPPKTKKREKKKKKKKKKMNNLQKFLSLDEVQRLEKKGDLESVGRLAISMGTISADNELRSYGASLLSKLERGK